MPLLERLHPVGIERDRSGHRQLFFGHYCAYVLLFLFNLIASSLRGIQQASELKNVQKKLGCPRTALGSLWDATQVFDPEPVKQIAAELAGQLEPLGPDRTYLEVKHLGTVVRTLSRIVQAAYLKSLSAVACLSGWRLHTHFEVERGLQVGIDVIVTFGPQFVTIWKPLCPAHRPLVITTATCNNRAEQDWGCPFFFFPFFRIDSSQGQRKLWTKHRDVAYDFEQHLSEKHVVQVSHAPRTDLSSRRTPRTDLGYQRRHEFREG